MGKGGIKLRLMSLRFKTALFAGASVLSVFACINAAFGYSGGTPNYVTDAAPYCARCHCSCSAVSLSNMPDTIQKIQLFPNKHYHKIETGQNEYKKMSLEDRKTLLADVKKADENASIQIIAPLDVLAGDDITVTVNVNGGAGPVVGVMLLDNDLRWQSRSIAADGWTIIGPPVIIGPDGKPQNTWISRRAEGLKKNINYAVIYGVTADIANNKWQSSSVSYTLEAPSVKGVYSMAAAFLYGTEKSSSAGYTQTIRGKLPQGGFESPSGRIMFSELVKVTVK